MPHLYVHYDDGAVSHLFHVAAGLDSMVVGEGQILGQTRDALRVGPGARHRRPRAQRALPAGAARRQALARRDRHRPRRPVAGHRRPRAHPRPGRPAAGSSSSAPARWPSLAAATVHRIGASDIAVVNRTPRPRRAPRRPSTPPGRSRSLDLDVELGRADVLISCTGATGVLHQPRRGRGRPRAHRRPRWPSSTWRCRTTSTRPSPTLPGVDRAGPGRAGRGAQGLRRRPRASTTSAPSSPRRSPPSSPPAGRPA